MMDPLSIATGCAGLLAGVSQLSAQISAFVSSVRDARKDMGAVSGELSSLALCLETLRDDSMKIDYPDGFRENLLTVLKNCDAVTTEMTALLDKLSSTNLLRKVQWTAMGKDDMNRLRSSLESHKSALEIGLDMTSLLLISAIKDDVADVKADTAQIRSIKQDTSQIEFLVQQIGFLRLQLDNSPVNDAKAQQLQIFLDQSTAYAETVLDAIEDEDPDVSPSEDLVLVHSNHNQEMPAADAAASSAKHITPLQASDQSHATEDTPDQRTATVGLSLPPETSAADAELKLAQAGQGWLAPDNPFATSPVPTRDPNIPLRRFSVRKQRSTNKQNRSDEAPRLPTRKPKPRMTPEAPKFPTWVEVPAVNTREKPTRSRLSRLIHKIID